MKKKKKISLTMKENKSYCQPKTTHICKKQFNTDKQKYYKVRDHFHYTGKYRGVAHNICSLRYKTPKEVPVIFQNGSKDDYHFLIKKLVQELEGQFEYQMKRT